MTDTGETMGLREVVARIRDAAQAALLTPATPTDVGTYLIPLTPENVDYIGAVAPARVLNILDDFAAQQARIVELEAALQGVRGLLANPCPSVICEADKAGALDMIRAALRKDPQQ